MSDLFTGKSELELKGSSLHCPGFICRISVYLDFPRCDAFFIYYLTGVQMYLT